MKDYYSFYRKVKPADMVAVEETAHVSDRTELPISMHAQSVMLALAIVSTLIDFDILKVLQRYPSQYVCSEAWIRVGELFKGSFEI